MAARRILLGAKNRSSANARELNELPDPNLEIGSRRTALVVDAAVLPIELGSFGTTAELPAQEDVVDGVPRHRLRQSGPVEVRHPLRAGMRSHVDEALDRVRTQERHEMLDRVS